LCIVLTNLCHIQQLEIYEIFLTGNPAPVYDYATQHTRVT